MPHPNGHRRDKQACTRVQGNAPAPTKQTAHAACSTAPWENIFSNQLLSIIFPNLLKIFVFYDILISLDF